MGRQKHKDIPRQRRHRKARGIGQSDNYKGEFTLHTLVIIIPEEAVRAYEVYSTVPHVVGIGFECLRQPPPHNRWPTKVAVPIEWVPGWNRVSRPW